MVVPGSNNLDIRDKSAVATRLRGSVSSKQNGYEDVICPLVAEACIDVCPTNPNNFNVDNVRVVKITGASLHQSQVVKGMVFKRDTEGTIKSMADAKVAVYAQGVDTVSTEGKVRKPRSRIGAPPRAGWPVAQSFILPPPSVPPPFLFLLSTSAPPLFGRQKWLSAIPSASCPVCRRPFANLSPLLIPLSPLLFPSPPRRARL